MSAVTSELMDFKQFLEAQIASGCTDLTPEESVRMWRQVAGELAESVSAVQRALTALDCGQRGKPLNDFVDEFRAQHEIPGDA
ncbi:MAG: hypothetical protein ACT4QC_17170 [Planctomycetaceae bacterium]